MADDEVRTVLGGMWRVCSKTLISWMYFDQDYFTLVLVVAAPAMLIMVINHMSWKMMRGGGGGRGSTLRLPPGPAGALPVIGHLHLLGPLPHQTMYELAKKHGSLMHLRLGSVPTIVASSPEMARRVLQTNDADMASRPAMAASKHLLFGPSDVGFSPAGPYWRRMRQLCVTELFSNRRLASFRAVREQEVRGLLASLSADGKKNIPSGSVAVLPALLTASSNIICRMAFGSTLSQLVAVCPDSDIVDMAVQALELIGAFNVGDFIPWLAWMDPQGYTRRMQALGSKLSAVFQDMIDRRRHGRRAPGTPPADLLDVLLTAAGENQISDDNIKGVTMDMLLGGIDTSSVTVEWALAELLANPSSLELLQEELARVVSKERLVQESDFKCLPYLIAVVKETMRLHPVAPLLAPHESMKHCRIDEYDIPAKARIYVNVWAIGRDPSVWSNPLEFSPERFMNAYNLDELGVLAKHYHLLPFGSGRRGCPGWSLGLINVQLMLANIVHAFEWKLQPSCDVSQEVAQHTMKNSPMDMSEKSGLVVKMARPLIAIATPRLPLDLFSM